MTRTIWFAPLLALGITAAPAFAHSAAPPAAAQQEASVPFANVGGIRDWRSEGQRAIYVQDRSHQWYKATLMSPSIDLPFSEAIGFDTGPIDTFDHFSNVIVHGQRYPVESLVKVDGPPAKLPRVKT